MHTNGGDRWLVVDRLHDVIVNDSRSQVKAREMVALLNTSADWFCNKPRFEMRRWDEYTNTVQKMDEGDVGLNHKGDAVWPYGGQR